MWTADYPHYRAPFPMFNVVQSRVVPHLDKDENLVVCFQTATGKTVLAECAFGYHLNKDGDSRVAYVVPFKSLGGEKMREWSGNDQLARFGISISTGDHVVSADRFMGARLALVTAESFDSKLRSQRYDGWVSRLSCVVFDEAHVMGSRCGSMEAAMMRLTAANPGARVILMSATLGNAVELSRWVKSLNGKETVCFRSEWRPVVPELRIHVVGDGFEEKVSQAALLAAEDRGAKTIVFVHSKSTGSELCRVLRGMGVRAVFHNASATRTARERMERDFSNPVSGLDVLVSTSTLSSGVNLC